MIKLVHRTYKNAKNISIITSKKIYFCNMCSSQVFASSEEIAAAFGLVDYANQDEITNGAPTDATPIITLQEPNKLQYFRWGFPWFGADDKQNLTTCIRYETASIKFKRLFDKKNRCLSISNGFLEFAKQTKDPYYFVAKDQPYTVIAALWDFTMEPKTGVSENRYSILTTTPNELVTKTHDRMPVILNKESQAIWMNSNSTFEDLEALFVAYDQANMEVMIMSKKINNSRNKNFKIDKLIDPKDRPNPEQGSLF
jgi:putative SOS response-associated peptidase YedK